MKRERFLVLLLFILFSSFSYKTTHNLDHAIYLSVVEIAQSSNTEIANIKVKVFTNDIEDAIRNYSGESIQLNDLMSCGSRKGTIEKYFTAHFTIAINNSTSVPLLEKCEDAGDATWFHFQVNCPRKWNQVNIKADFLMELFPTQANVITIQQGANKRFIRLTNAKSSELVKF